MKRVDFQLPRLMTPEGNMDDFGLRPFFLESRTATFSSQLPANHWQLTNILWQSRLLRLLGSFLKGQFPWKFTSSKSSRLGGHVTPSSRWLNCLPKAKLRRPLGNCTRSMLLLNITPRVKLWRFSGKVTSSKLWLN